MKDLLLSYKTVYAKPHLLSKRGLSRLISTTMLLCANKKSRDLIYYTNLIAMSNYTGQCAQLNITCYLLCRWNTNALSCRILSPVIRRDIGM